MTFGRNWIACRSISIENNRVIGVYFMPFFHNFSHKFEKKTDAMNILTTQ